MHGLRLRGYQQEALAAVDDELTRVNRTAVVLPTGLGKTVVFAELIRRATERGQRALVLVHREELAEQAKAKVHSAAPHLSVGIVKAERNEVDADVIVASVQTLASVKRREQVTGIGIVIVDECHHAVARTWMEVLTHFGCFGCTCPDIGDDNWKTAHDDGCPDRNDRPTPCVGFTATLTRTDGKGLGDVWESVAYEKDILYGIDNGYLAEPRGKAVTVDGLDLATVAKSRGDYQEGQLGEAMEAAGAGEVIARAYREHAGGRQGVLFAPTVATADSFADSLRAAGIVTELITGETSREDRDLIFKRYAAGEIQVLSNVMVLTEGWDMPQCSVAVIARPTQSPGLYTQMVGRVLRPFPGKVDALVLDVVGVAGQHKLQSLTQLVKTEVRDGESLSEARERIAKEIKAAGGSVARGIGGAVAARDVELFANSHSVWLQTYGGTWFIPVRGGIVFLWPESTPGLYTVGVKDERGKGERVIEGVTLEYGMAHGEQLAEERDPMVATKGRSWRRTKPSAAQMDLAIRLQLADPAAVAEMRKGELSDLISVHMASRQLGQRRPEVTA